MIQRLTSTLHTHKHKHTLHTHEHTLHTHCPRRYKDGQSITVMCNLLWFNLRLFQSLLRGVVGIEAPGMRVYVCVLCERVGNVCVFVCVRERELAVCV
jgi:hypothetical protein